MATVSSSPTDSAAADPTRNILLKLCYLRRSKIRSIAPDLAFSQLLALVSSAFPETCSATCLELAFLDKAGDTVLVDSDESLRFAILDFRPSEAYLKVQINIKPQKSDGRQSPGPGFGSRDGHLVVPVCRHFSKTGSCKFGSSCRFSHTLRDSPKWWTGTSIGAAKKSDSPFLANRAIQSWLIQQDQSSGSDNVLYFSSAKGFDELMTFLNHTNLCADVIHQFVTLLTRHEIRTTLLRHAASKVYNALVGSVFLTQLHAHIRSKLERTPSQIEPYVALTEELVGRTSNGWKEVPLDELKMAVDELQTDDDAARKLRHAVARLLDQRQKKKRLDAAGDQAESLSNITEFRKVPIIPSKEQLFCESTNHLPVNKIESMYPSVAAYLDMHFRLMQEDCIGTLREGLRNLRNNSRDPDLRVYTAARVVEIQFGDEAIVYRIKFSAKNFRTDINWESSKRLMYGSLLCISHDRFQTYLWAVVANRSPKMLSERVVDVRVLLDESDQTMKANREYTIVESSAAYFEAYSHVLKNLQRPEMDDLPFQEHLISLEPRVREPSYLNSRIGQDLYDFESVFPQLLEELHSSKLQILQDWPKWTSSLDTSQIAALKHGLTKRLALIQGPPGTGKTFIGLLIVKILLKNLKYNVVPTTRRNSRGRPGTWPEREVTRENLNVIEGPIVVVCYTNHALDQFLEGIWEEEKNIVRIGGRCKSQELAECSLQTHLKQWNASLPARLREESNQAWRRKKELEEEIHGLVEKMNKGVATIESLQGIATEDQIKSLFFEGCDQKTAVSFWLNEEDKRSEVRYANLQNGNIDAPDENPYNMLISHGNTSKNDNWMQLEVESCQKYTSQGAVEVHNGNGSIKGPLDVELGVESRWDSDALEKRVVNNRISEIRHDDTDSMPTPKFDQGQSESLAVSCDKMVHVQESCLDSDCSVNILENTVKDDSCLETYDDNPGSDPVPEPDQGQGPAVSQYKMVFSHENMEQMILLQQNQHMADVMESPVAEWTQVKRKKRPGCETARDIYTDTVANHQLELQDDQWPLEILVDHADVWSLNRQSRRQLHKYWLEEIRNDVQKNIAPLSAEYEVVCERKLQIDNQCKLQLLREVKVVGMTTTAAARCHTLLESLHAEIVIVEEAAEVLESHILACLTGSTKHLILIGDHLQLRPSVALYEMSVKYHLDVSMFERLVKGGIEYVTLEVQRRMSPCISRLISGIYPMMKDHDSVLSHENVKGIKTNVFFFNHQALEGQRGDDDSGKVNVEEAQLVVELCSYLLKQGYNSTDITILSMYKGQIREIFFWLTKKLSRKPSDEESLKKRIPRVSSVDDYQGEECKIIILSLVRSNHLPSKNGPGRIGFLGISNRICVALSRAKNGLFIFGNGDLLAKGSNHWRTVIQELCKSGSYGGELVLCCQNHQGTETKICKPNDFQEVADGGCNRPCDHQLGCGHACPKLCHPDDHSKIVCPKRCPRKLASCSHQCQSLCHGSTDCPPCQEPVDKELPKCQHIQRVSCSSLIESVVCTTPCQKILACGHKCRSDCGRACTSTCFERVEKNLPCGHVVKIACHQDPAKYICTVPCRVILSPGCEHPCAGSCSACKQGREHIPCRKKCGRTLFCGHICRSDCCRVCPPCPIPCQKRCLHSRCQQKCGNPCIPCVEPCAWNCEHYSCGLPCFEPCRRPRCNEPCKRLLRCGHSCLGLCGERCPSICRICTPQFKDSISQMSMDEFEATDRFVQLQDCGHVFEVDGLDMWMKMEEPESSTGSTQTMKPKQCPECKTPVSQSWRYGSIVKAKHIQFGELKKKVNSLDLTNEGNKYLREKKYGLALQKFEAAIISCATNFEAHFGLGSTLCFLSEFNLAVDHFHFVVKHSSFADTARHLRPKIENLTSTSSAVIARADGSLALDALTQWASALANLKEFSEAIKACDIVLQAQPDRKEAADIRRLASNRETAIMVVEVMRQELGTRGGHWFQCPNGHFYAVGECGGPMQESRCPDCKAVVGGQSHTPAPGNRHSDIDGSTHSAWNNMTGLGDLHIE